RACYFILVHTTFFFFFFQAEDGIRDGHVTGVQTCALPISIQAYRDSTKVDSGNGPKRQIDHMSNYSFDYGNVHFVFLEANPHVFGGQLDGTANYLTALQAFSAYPSVLREWLINDLDPSSLTWKIVVFHQPAFSSGNAT